MKNIQPNGYFIIVAAAACVGLITFGGCTPLDVPDNQTRAKQPENIELQSTVSAPLTQPMSEAHTTPAHTASDKPGAQFPVPTVSLSPGYSAGIVQVKFREGTDVHPPEAVLPSELRSSVASITRLFSLPEEKLDEIRATAESRSPQKLPDLTLWFQITLKPGADPAAFLEAMRRLDSVEIVEPAPLPAPPP